MDAQVYTVVLLLLLCINHGVDAGIMEFCGYDYGGIHKGFLHKGNANIYETKVNMRSKVECATYCYADRICRTAVYQPDGDCLLISNFTERLTYDEYSGSNMETEEIIQLKTTSIMGTGGVVQEEIICPSACTGYSVCFLDCTGDVLDPEPGCMDITTTQYTQDGCGFHPHVQSKEYYLAGLDRESSSSGYTHFTVKFTKKFDWTTLQVRFRGTLRGGFNWGGGWGRWRILFNGGHCANPGWIESLNYNAESDTSHHKASGINGICYGLAAGIWDISLNSEVSSSLFRSGWATDASRLYVEEIGQGTWTGEPAVKHCPSLQSFNFREHITTTTWSNEPNVALWDIYYTKMEANTWVRITVDFILRQYFAGVDSSSCSTWYIRHNGANCSPTPLGKTVANLAYCNQVNNEHRHAEFEGHCSGIPAGYQKFTLYLETCPWGGAYRDTETGWNAGRNRIIFEEYHAGTNIVGVMSPDGETMYRVPNLNVVTHGLGHPARGDDNAEVWSIPDFNKIYRTSGVRVVLSADGRSYYHDSGSYDPCCRHYFRFNGAECTNPGTIEGIHYLNKQTNLHRPIMIEGICEGLAAGTVQLRLNAGICKLHSRAGECYFGWNSYVHLMVSEAFVDREIVQF